MLLAAHPGALRPAPAALRTGRANGPKRALKRTAYKPVRAFLAAEGEEKHAEAAVTVHFTLIRQVRVRGAGGSAAASLVLTECRPVFESHAFRASSVVCHSVRIAMLLQYCWLSSGVSAPHAGPTVRSNREALHQIVCPPAPSRLSTHASCRSPLARSSWSAAAPPSWVAGTWARP